MLASSRYDQSAAYAPQRGKQDGAEDQSELTLWFMKAELLMLTGFLKIIVVVNIHVKRETVIHRVLFSLFSPRERRSSSSSYCYYY